MYIHVNVYVPHLQILNREAAYRVVIIPGSGSENEMIFDIETGKYCNGSSCNYTFASDSINDSYSVAVEVVGCISERFNCTNISSCKFMYCDYSFLLLSHSN